MKENDVKKFRKYLDELSFLCENSECFGCPADENGECMFIKYRHVPAYLNHHINVIEKMNKLTKEKINKKYGTESLQ